MNPCVGGGGIHVVVTTSNMALDGGEWAASLYGHFVPGKSSLSPLYMRAIEPESQSGRSGEEKNLSRIM
jgi:hypothetical protein